MEDIADLKLPETSDLVTLRQRSRKAFDEQQSRRDCISRDGVNVSKPDSYVPRTKAIETLTSSLLQSHSILVRAPPATGKTSLSQLLYAHLFDTRTDVLPVLVSCLEFVKKNKYICEGAEVKTFEAQFANKSGTQMSIYELSGAVDEQVVIIIDEAQLLYEVILTDIWESLKSGLPRNIYIIFFAAYGESVRGSSVSTPYEFPRGTTFGLKDLLLTRDEFDLLTSRLCPHLDAYENAKHLTLHSSGGHIGLITTVFNALADYSKFVIQRDPTISERLSEDMVISFLFSPKLAGAVRDSRSFALNSHENVDVQSSSLCQQLATMFLDTTNVPYTAEHNELIKSGILIVSTDESGMDEVISFSAPLIRRAFMTHILDLQRSGVVDSLVQIPLPHNLAQLSLREFVMACLRNLRKDNLLNSNAIATCGSLNESKFKLEFFYIARQLLKNHARIDPEVGNVFKTKDNASVDFYINGTYQWAIEFLVQSDRLGSHLKRFAEDGKYKPIPCKDYIVVDFVVRSSDAPPARASKFKNNDKYLRVQYDETLSNFMVQHLDETTILPIQ
eukprot:gene37351-45351_t